MTIKKILLFLAALWLVTYLLPPSAAAQYSLFSDVKARQPGDVITVRLEERTAAQRESGWENEKSGRLGGTGSLDGGSTLSGTFGMDARFDQETTRRNESVQSDLLRGTLSVVITQIDSLSGNVQVEGERSLNVNGETHLMKVTGTVRPYDIRGDNSIFSYQLANAMIEYKRAGGIKKAIFSRGTLIGVGTVLMVGAAAFVGMQN